MGRFVSLPAAATALAAVACTVALAGPQAQAAAPSAGQSAPSVLVMTVTEGAWNPQAPVDRAVDLRCAPVPGGDHPAAAASCASLRVTDGSISAQPTLQTFCADTYQPVTVTAQGIWQGQPISYLHTFPNRCMLHRATGELFDF